MIDVEMLRPTADELLSGLSAGEAMKQRLLFTAKAVERLPQIADEMLDGLNATPALRHRILVAVERKERTRSTASVARGTDRPKYARFTPAIGMALVLTLMIGLGASYGVPPMTTALPGASPTAQSDFNAGMAGDGTVASTDGVPQFRSLYAVGEGANPPLIGINGRFYRMLNVHVPDSILGTQLSEIAEYTDEPSLTASVGTVSNIAKAGTRIYAVDGLSSKTACIAEVDGTLRLFQRVGYASASLVGNELFQDTLDVGGKVTALELSGVGVITDEEEANELMYLLAEFAAFHSNDSGNGSQALTIYLDNGLSLQLMVQGDILSGCGSWTCPEFFESFQTTLTGQA